MLDLASHDLVPEQLGGNQIVVPISAKEKVNINLLNVFANYIQIELK